MPFNPIPTITSISPMYTSTGGGNVITITGTGFLTGAIAFLGNGLNLFQGSTPTVVSSTQMTIIVPPLALSNTPYDIYVQNTDWQAGILTGVLTVATAAGISLVPEAVYTSLLTSGNPVYNQTAASITGSNTQRAIALGTNVEVLFYSGIDTVNNKILNVYRKQLGSTASRHGGTGISPGDIVFKGIASIETSPFLYGTATSNNIGHVECLLRANGQITMKTRQSNGFALVDDTQLAYASYQAVLVKSLTQLSIPQIGTANCQ